MNILGIETSCDETGVAIYRENVGIVGEKLYSQVKLHQKFGGVVPELASRDHARKLPKLIEALLTEADIAPQEVDAIAYTAGPGLIGALLVGASVANGLALAWNRPVIPVHHMEGHLLAPLLGDPAPSFPFLALLVSGGHTMIIEAQALGEYTLLGETLDDAAGEAFDKTAKLLNLPYPGGPELAKLATTGDREAYKLTRPLCDRPGVDFSFSGLKTQVLNTWNQCDQSPIDRANLAASFEEAVIQTLTLKCRRAITQTGVHRLVVAGGVSANTRLRTVFETLPADVYFPKLSLCTDNGAMIAYAGYCRRSEARPPSTLAARPRWPLSELKPPASPA